MHKKHREEKRENEAKEIPGKSNKKATLPLRKDSILFQVGWMIIILSKEQYWNKLHFLL